MPQKKKLAIDTIDIDTIPFQSRNTLSQHMLRALKERVARTRDAKHFACQLTISMQELQYEDRIIV